jgi:SNF2 family DNA or RNA helicase
LIKKLTAALAHKKIEFLEIKGSSPAQSDSLDKFQRGTGRVLILNVTEQKAAGANLTCANHAIFLSPLLSESNEKYKANETQAIGRLVRFGQQKPVTIWRMVAADTIDEEIYEQRKAALATVPE